MTNTVKEGYSYFYDEYVSTADLNDYTATNLHANISEEVLLVQHNKKHLRNLMFKGGGDLASKFLAGRPLSYQIGDWIFSHADICLFTEPTLTHIIPHDGRRQFYLDAKNFDLDKLNQIAFEYLKTGIIAADAARDGNYGDRDMIGIGIDEDNPMWSRNVCRPKRNELKVHNLKTDPTQLNNLYVAAHSTVQTITSSNGNQIWCIDTQRSLAFKNNDGTDKEWHNQQCQSLRIEFQGQQRYKVSTIFPAKNVESVEIDHNIVSRRLRGGMNPSMSIGLGKSTRPDKLYMALVGNVKVHFGRKGVYYFTSKSSEDKTALKRKFLREHDAEDWSINGILTPAFWTRWVLWNKPSKAESIKNMEQRFNISIHQL
jgi:hypothetical protein